APDRDRRRRDGDARDAPLAEAERGPDDEWKDGVVERIPADRRAGRCGEEDDTEGDDGGRQRRRLGTRAGGRALRTRRGPDEEQRRDDERTDRVAEPPDRPERRQRSPRL